MSTAADLLNQAADRLDGGRLTLWHGTDAGPEIDAAPLVAWLRGTAAEEFADGDFVYDPMLTPALDTARAILETS